MSTIGGPLVGTAIMGARQIVPDMPGVLTPPTTITAAVVSASGSTLPAGTYALNVTFRNQWGETLDGIEVTGLVVGANQGIQVTGPALPTGATLLRIYLTAPGGTAGTESQWVETATIPYTISIPLTNAGYPPVKNTAFLPDTDGGFISCSTIYQWLNEGLSLLARESGGYTDYSGIPSVFNQPLYVIQGEWNEITSVWYDGYWMSGGDRGLFFRRNNITSQVLCSVSISTVSNRNIMEVYPQPARTAANTTLAAPMTATANTATLTSAANFLLPFGFFMVDNEVMSYATINNNVLGGIVRAFGGSQAVAHADGAPVNETNIFWSGRRQTTQIGGFAPGSSQSVLPTPSGWQFMLINYIAGRAKLAEHDGQSYQQLVQEIRNEMKEWGRTNKGVATRRQIGGSAQPAVLFPTPAGGLILP